MSKLRTGIKERWVEALRSGNYTQGTTFLNGRDGFCCLGVLCDVYLKDKGMEWEGYDKSAKVVPGTEDTASLPRAVRDWSGFEDSLPWVETEEGPRMFSVLNDVEELTFNEIANLIEKDVTL